jgi:glucose-6-phosphate 1-dehydrogenase
LFTPGEDAVAHTFVIFGASGDLTARKLIPALFVLHKKKRLPPDTRIVGFSRTAFSHVAWREKLAASTKEFAPEDFSPELFDAFAKQVYYHSGDIGKQDDFLALAGMLSELEGNAPTTRVYYLATAPQFYEPAVAHLGGSGLSDETLGARRVVIEKPFGTSLDTARKLNTSVHDVFHENQIYRIDHYLGKETVQNIMVLRFANSIFEPIWNRNYVDHVQITVAEEVAVGRRGDYYETAGVMRDMFQNHLLQLLMVVAMEAPVRYRADSVRDEKVKVLQAIRPMADKDVATHTVRGQYEGYLQEPGVNPQSETATFAAIRLEVDNWRWQGVPFYLRSGKAMSCRTTQIVIQFREPPTMLFASNKQMVQEANRLVIQIQPAEGIELHFQTKTPDAGMDLRLTDLSFNFRREFAAALPEAYQRLLLDTLNGDASLFARADEVEASWGIIDPILETWATHHTPGLATYPQGMWGPDYSFEWMSSQGRNWFDTCPILK